MGKAQHLSDSDSVAAGVQGSATRDALLEAGAEVFGRRGFRDATIREICRRARANVAAVRYHFGDKERFYHEVLAAAGRQVEVPPPPVELPAEARLRDLVGGMLRTVLEEGSGAWYGQLMAREMIEPTAALDGVVDRFIRPQARRMEALVREISEGRLRREAARRCAMGVVGQILFYRHCRPVLNRLYPGSPLSARQREALADHITRFSLAGIRAAAATPADPTPR